MTINAHGDRLNNYAVLSFDQNQELYYEYIYIDLYNSSEVRDIFHVIYGL